MALSEDTMWSFEKVELPLTTEHDSWPDSALGNEHGSYPIQQAAETEIGREDNNSSSTVSGRPLLDQRLAKAFKVVHRRRDKLVEKRVKVAQQRREHEYQRKAVQASSQRIIDTTETLLRRFGIDASSSPDYLALLRAMKEFTDRVKILESMEVKLQESTEGVNLKEAELFSKEKKVYKRLATLTGLTNHPPARELPPPKRSTSSKSTTQTHPRARKYYDRAGLVKNLRDKIHNMQVQHQQDLLSRQVGRESGHITKLPERLFHQRFYEKLASILEELERAKKEAFLLKLACERQGIVLEEEVETHRGQDDYDAPLLMNDRVTLPELGGNQISRNSSFLLDELLSGYNDTTNKIRRWLNGIPQDTQEMKDALPRDDDIRQLEFGIPINLAQDPPFLDPLLMDIPAPIENPIYTPQWQSSHPFTIEDAEAEAEAMMEMASVLSGEPPSSSDREFSQQDFVGEAPRRRYSDPLNPEFAARKVLGLGLLGSDGHKSRRASH